MNIGEISLRAIYQYRQQGVGDITSVSANLFQCAGILGCYFPTFYLKIHVLAELQGSLGVQFPRSSEYVLS